MKLFFITLFTTCLLLFGCNEERKSGADLIEEGEMMNSSLMDTCSCNDLVADSTGILLKDHTPYTGVCIHNYANTRKKYMTKNILKGQLHGTFTYYDMQGNLLFEEVYQNGEKKRSGNNAPLTCNCNELDKVNNPGETIKRAFLDGIPFNGKCLNKYPNSNQLYMEVNYKSGLMNGFTIFYDQQGNTMYMEKYEMGQLLRVIHPE